MLSLLNKELSKEHPRNVWVYLLGVSAGRLCTNWNMDEREQVLTNEGDDGLLLVVRLEGIVAVEFTEEEE